MSEFSHTPAPWAVVIDSATCIQIVMAEPAGICTIQNDVPGGLDEVDWGNANLIAAAPELLAACEAILKDDAEYMADDGVMYPDYLGDALARIEAAVRKARGRDAA